MKAFDKKYMKYMSANDMVQTDGGKKVAYYKLKYSEKYSGTSNPVTFFYEAVTNGLKLEANAYIWAWSQLFA